MVNYETEGGLNCIKFIKYGYAFCLLLFSVFIVMALIFSGQTKLANDVHPALAFCVIWIAVLWLNLVEGGQGALVGLPPVKKDLYKESHPITWKVCVVAHRGDNLDRYLIGRQFMVLLIVFVTNLSGGPLPGATVLGLPDIILQIFLGSGLAMILMTTQIGQLNSQVNASHCMLDYINTYFMMFTVWVALAIEASGLLHSCYLVQIAFAKMAGTPVESAEPPMTDVQSFLFWFRALASTAILGFALAVTLEALFRGNTTMWQGVPEAVSVILFFLFMSIVGLLEGMQIAFFAVTKITRADQDTSPMAKRTCDLLLHDGGHNLPGFMIGRQICVTMCFFIIARVTTINIVVGVDENIFGVSNGVQEFFNTGLLGALITTILASITWQLVASAFPVVFLSNPMVYIFLRICLLLEATGICDGAWVLADIHKRIAGFQVDTVYIGTPEERKAREMADEVGELHVGGGHMVTPTHPVGTTEQMYARSGSQWELFDQGEGGDAEAGAPPSKEKDPAYMTEVSA